MNSSGLLVLVLRLVVVVLSVIPSIVKGDTLIQAWAQRYNGTGSNSDDVISIAIDHTNNVIVTGTSLGNGTSFDFATVKYSSQGLALWTNRCNGASSRSDSAVAVVVDSNDNIIVTGSSALFTNTVYEFLTVKYSPSGLALWTNHLNLNASAQPAGLAVDSNNNVVVTGTVSNDLVTVAYSSAGVPLWTNIYNGPGNGGDSACGVAIGSDNGVVVAGTSANTNFSPGYVVIKYSSSGVGLWTNRYDASAQAMALTLDNSNNVVVTGRATPTGYYSYGTIKYSSAGVPLWTNFFSAPTHSTYANAITTDRDGNVFVTGSVFVGLYEDVATVSYSSAGVPRWTNFFNSLSNQTDIGRGVKVDANNNVIVAAYSSNYVALRYSNAGVPLSTNEYTGPVAGSNGLRTMAVDYNGDFIVAGGSGTPLTANDYATVKYFSPPAIATITRTNGAAQLELYPPNAVVIEASSDLSIWTSIFTNINASSKWTFSDPNSGGKAPKFYRAFRLVP